MHRIPSPIVSPRPRRPRPGASSRKAGSNRMTTADRRPFEPLESRVLFAAGDFDTTFGGGDGATTTDFTSTADSGSALVVQSDGKIIVGGSVGNGTNTDDVFGITRYNADGSLDLSFGGGDGKATIDFGPDADLNNIALAPDGKIVAVGQVVSAGGGFDWAVARFNADGSPDTTFSNDGMVTTDFFGFADTATAVDVQADGKIVVAGNATAATAQIAVVRYNANGTVDATFNASGQQIVDAFGGADAASAIKIQPDNKLIVVGGSVQPGSYRRFVLARINANGTMDSTFSDDGVASANFGAAAFGKDVEILPDGRYVVGGWVDTNPQGEQDRNDFAVARFNSNGTLDTSFGSSGGHTTVPGTAGHVLGSYGLEVQADGKLVLGGTIKDPNFDTNFMNYAGVARFNPNGTVDVTFGTAGLRQFSVPGTTAGRTTVSDLELQGDGKILVAGFLTDATLAPTDFAVVRLVNDVVVPPGTGSVSGLVFNDQDEDGVRDAGEPALPGWTVYDDANGNGIYDAGGLTVSSNVPRVIEADPGGEVVVTSSIVVSNAPATITDVNVTLNIQHTWDRDLVISLVSPGGQEILLVNRRGSSGDNFTNTVLDDEAATPISAGLPPFTGSFRPEQLLSALDGTNPNGTWTLRVRDVESGEGGAIQAWSITIGTPGEASAVTAADGTYTLSNLPAGSRTIREVVQPAWSQTAPAGGAHAVTVVENQTVTGRDFGNVNRVIAATVTGRHVFYNRSAFDGNNPAANAADDAAVATNKQALRPGQTATLANVTSYSRGINGIMIDMTRMPSNLDADDFEFRVGNSELPGTWAIAPAPVSVTERLGTGANPAMRVSIVWADGAIRDQWLQVTVKANADTRLTSPDVFYFGNLVGETVATAGATSFTVNANDFLATRAAHRPGTTVAVTSPADHNRDRRVNVLDEVLVRQNMGRSLRVLAAPGGAAASPFGNVEIAGATADRRLRLAPASRSVLA